MTVKDEAGRWRYIAFEPPQPAPSRHGLNRALGDAAWRLTVYTDAMGILRVPHTDAQEARRQLEKEGARPVTTSGSIKQAKQRAGIQGA